MVEFRGKLESALAPLIAQLRVRLASLPTLSALNNYQLLIDLAQDDKSKFPDGFIFKWRYLWALVLSCTFSGKSDDPGTNFESIDKLIEEIFNAYEFGALWEPGRTRGSKKEYLTRLGLAIRVREPDILGFPEQIRNRALTRLQPFNQSYFLPKFGLNFEEIIAWLDELIRISEDRLNACVRDLQSIAEDLEPIRAGFVGGQSDIDTARKKSSELRIRERIESNASQGHRLHVFTIDEVRVGIPGRALQALLKQFGIRPGEVSLDFKFPHDENPLEYKTLIVLPDDSVYFLDPANVYRVVAKTFEREILVESRLKARYLKNRDQATERLVTGNIRKVFPSAAVYPNYYLERDSRLEKDLLVQDGNTLILIECKNSGVRTFKGTAADLLNFERDFEHSVQFGFEQANEVKHRILESEETTFFDRKGRPYFSVKRSDVENIYIVCVTMTPRGPFGTDLSYELKKSEDEPYPLALNLFDFETICKHINRPDQFIAYLRARERLHGRVHTGDELNFAGYFLKYGHLDFQDHTFLHDEFSGIFDREWLKEKGIEVEEPSNPPVQTSMIRKGNRVIFTHSTGRTEEIKIAPEMMERATGKPAIKMKGSDRNMPCPCGSGHKLKNCCGIS